MVAGATRGAGRGIARALGEAGATVYCTGRSVKGRPSPYKRPETIEETAAMIGDAGGRAIPVRVDHTVEAEVKALFRRIDRTHRRLDVLVNSIAGEDPMMGQWGHFWKVDVTNADAILRQALTSHIITAKHAAPLMIRNGRGLIVEVTESDLLGAGGNPLSQTVKAALKMLALNMAAELKTHGVVAVAITPGFLRSESMLQHFGVTEANWRDAGNDRSELSRIGVAALRRAGRCGAGGQSPRHRTHRTASQLVGACRALRLLGLRRPASELGPARHRLVGAASGHGAVVQDRNRPATRLAYRARQPHTAFPPEAADGIGRAREALPFGHARRTPSGSRTTPPRREFLCRWWKALPRS